MLVLPVSCTCAYYDPIAFVHDSQIYDNDQNGLSESLVNPFLTYLQQQFIITYNNFSAISYLICLMQYYFILCAIDNLLNFVLCLFLEVNKHFRFRLLKHKNIPFKEYDFMNTDPQYILNNFSHCLHIWHWSPPLLSSSTWYDLLLSDQCNFFMFPNNFII